MPFDRARWSQLATLLRAEELAKNIRDRTASSAAAVRWEGSYRIPEGTDIVVNATSIGLYPDLAARVPLDLESLRPGMIVCDVIPNPPRTRLLDEAEARGCKILDGLGMLVNQGIIGIQLWSGRTPRPEIMRSSLEAVFAATGPSAA